VLITRQSSLDWTSLSHKPSLAMLAPDACPVTDQPCAGSGKTVSKQQAALCALP